MQALVYYDRGASEQSADALVKSLKTLLDPSILVKKVDSTYLKTSSWEGRTVVLAMGGGICSQWDAQLQDEERKKIHEYVRKGGKFLGLCAGAYYESQHTSFSLPGGSCMEKKRSFPFFPGKAIGPLVQVDDYLSPSAARAAAVAFKIRGKVQPGALYYQGGCFFDVAQESSQLQIIARYRSFSGELPAAINCKVGKGGAFLCGLHPEFAWTEDLKEGTDPIVASLAEELCPQESFRRQVWKEIGEMLSLSDDPVRRKIVDRGSKCRKTHCRKKRASTSSKEDKKSKSVLKEEKTYLQEMKEFFSTSFEAMVKFVFFFFIFNSAGCRSGRKFDDGLLQGNRSLRNR